MRTEGREARAGAGERPPLWTQTATENLVFVILAGLGVSFWTHYYTDWFPIVATVLSLGGALSWVVFVLKAIPEDRMKRLAERIYHLVLERSGTKALAITVIVITAVFGSFTGSIELDSQPDSPFRTFQMHYGQSSFDLDSGDWLESGTRLRRVFFTSWIWPSRIHIKVDGLPDRIVDLKPWNRVEVRVPGSLFRPVVLLVPTKELIRYVRNNPLKLAIFVGASDSPKGDMKFDGHAVWIGCDSEVDVPSHLLDEWKRTESASFQFWSKPVASSPEPPALKAGDEVRAVVMGSDGKVYTEAKFIVRRPQRFQDFPQLEDINVP